MGVYSAVTPCSYAAKQKKDSLLAAVLSLASLSGRASAVHPPYLKKWHHTLRPPEKIAPAGDHFRVDNCRHFAPGSGLARAWPHLIKPIYRKPMSQE